MTEKFSKSEECNRIREEHTKEMNNPEHDLHKQDGSLFCFECADLCFEAGHNKKYDLCDFHDNRPKIFCSKCADKIKLNARKEVLKEIEKWAIEKIKCKPDRKNSWLGAVLRVCNKKLEALKKEES